MKLRTAENILIAAIFIMMLLAMRGVAAPAFQIDPAMLDPDQETVTEEPTESEDNGSGPARSYSVIMSDDDQDGDYDTFVIREDNGSVSNESVAEDQSFDCSSKFSSKTCIIAKYKKNKIRYLTLWSKRNHNANAQEWSIRGEFIRTVIKNWAIYTAKSWIKVRKAVSLITFF